MKIQETPAYGGPGARYNARTSDKDLYGRKILRTTVAAGERFGLSGDNRFGMATRSYIMISYDKNVLKLELYVRPAIRI